MSRWRAVVMTSGLVVLGAAGCAQPSAPADSGGGDFHQPTGISIVVSEEGSSPGTEPTTAAAEVTGADRGSTSSGSGTLADLGWPAWFDATDLRDAAAITVVRGAELEEVMAAFGVVGEPVRPWDPAIATPDQFYEVEPWASFAEVPGGVVVVEPNGYAAINPALLELASVDALAMVVYWNVELDTAVMVAEDGELIADLPYSDLGVERLQELAGSLEVPAAPDGVDAVAWGLQAQPVITGLELTPELWQQMSSEASAYQLEPPDWP